jgi:uncharacterized coiled-coil protein SlyX
MPQLRCVTPIESTQPPTPSFVNHQRERSDLSQEGVIDRRRSLPSLSVHREKAYWGTVATATTNNKGVAYKPHLHPNVLYPNEEFPAPDFDQPLFAPPSPPTQDIGTLLSQFIVQITAKLDENIIKLEEQSVKVDRTIAELKEQISKLDARLENLEQSAAFDRKLRVLHPSSRLKWRSRLATSTPSWNS